MTKEEITKAYESLAPIVRDVIDNSNWEDQLTVILKKNNLRIDQVSVIENNTVLVMLGLMSVGDFVLSLKEDADISNQDTIDSIIGDIETAIFAKIREALIQSTTTAADTAGKPGPVTTPQPVATPRAEESREDILKQIEDPIESAIIAPTPKPVVEKAIEAPTTAVAPTIPVLPPTKSTDPYREPIE